MLFGIPASEMAFLALAIVGAGVIAGLFAGLLGIGGAAIVVPVLYELFRLLDVPDTVRMQLCVGTSLAIIVPLSIRSHLAHKAQSEIRMGVLKVWAIPVVVGVVTGSVIAYFAPSGLFKFVFMFFAYGIGIKNLIGGNAFKFGDTLPGKPILSAIGYFIGLFSSLIGVAGGALSTLFLTLFGETIHVAIATSSGVGIYIALPGAIGYMIAGWPQQALLPPLSIGYVSFLGLLLFAPASVLAAPYGAKLAHKLTRRKLEIAFGLFLVLVATRFLVALFY
jgi:uncharacterized membrane protein YfcA